MAPVTGLESIVVATDGGPGSRAALRWVADHVGARPAAVRLVAVSDETEPDAPAALSAAGTVLRTLTDSVTVESELLSGDPAEAIAEAAADASLLVIGTKTGGGMLTSPRVPARVAALAPCPVVVVPHDWSPGTGAIVAASSFDAAADAAVARAATLASRQGRPLVLVHAWELPVAGGIPPAPGGSESIPQRQADALDRIADDVRTAHPGLEVSAVVRQGGPAEQISEVARGASLLVVGRRRRPAAARLLLGSMSHDLVSHPPCPVMVIPAPEAGLDVAPDVEHEDL